MIARKDCIASLTIMDGDSPLSVDRVTCDQRSAIESLHEGRFQPLNDNNGPYALRLSVEESRLVFRMRNALDEDIQMLVLSGMPYRRLIHDYFLVLESHEAARRMAATRDRLEALDMARRSLHNEGAELLSSRLKDRISMDFETARRLFTLICVLYRR